jgi:hypothetical protein
MTAPAAKAIVDVRRRPAASAASGRMCRCRRVVLAVVLALVGSGSQQGATADDPFVQQHCSGCHDRDGHEAGLNLEDMQMSPVPHASMVTLERVYDRISRGEMPPAGEEQPSAVEKAAFLDRLGKGLRQTGLERQATEGRGPVRRLTRAEYENTVKDLLQINVSLAELFPDDASTDGFDKVGAGLTLSASHFEAYQLAADKALAEAIPDRKFAPLTYSEDAQGVFNRRRDNFANYGCWLEEDAFIVTSRLFYPYTAILAPSAPRGGRYRVRVTAQARNSDGKDLPLGIGVHSNLTAKPDAPDLEQWHDFSELATSTITTQIDLQAEQWVHIFGVTLWQRDFVIPKYRRGQLWDKSALAIKRFEVEGPLKADGTLETWPPESYRILFDTLPLKLLSQATKQPASKGIPDPWVPVSEKPKEDAERLMRRFLPKAFRRPVPEEIVAEYVGRVHGELDAGVPFHQAMRNGFKAVLCSPHFLLLEEAPGPLDPHAIASRLSYFLWDGPPDESLLAAASTGELARPEARRSQVERMLADPRSARFERSFTDQWLDLRRIEATSPDGVLYPEFDAAMQLSSLRETQCFFHDMLTHDRSLLEGIHSDWTYLNEPLAALYGLPDVQGHELRRASLPAGSHRGGFLTQASVLKVTADGSKTSPILRGKWVTERILGVTPPGPPDDIPTIEPDIRGATTIRVQLEKHRSNPACVGCHRVIDPPGFALESFDVVGGWRDHYRVPQSTGAVIEVPRIKKRVHRGPAVELGYTMPDGRPFADVDVYKQLLLEDRDGLARALASKLLMYATGAPVQFADRADVDALIEEIRGKNYGLRSLVHAIVQSRPFLNK